jgi:radical SAM protein with 4Fe4S-binding SPASM domain
MEDKQFEMFKAVEIEINSACNMACSYCPNSVDERIEQGEMSVELYELLMNQLVEMGFVGRISYDFYNEPMMCTNFDLFVKMTKKYLPDSRLVIYSNGSFLTPKRFEEAVANGVHSFIITKHEGVKKLAFDKTYAGLSEEQKKIVKYQHHTDLEQENKLTNRGGVLEGVGPESIPNLLPCYIPSSMLTVSVKGNVIPCFEDFYQKNMMGNIQDKHLKDIWNDEHYQEHRYQLRKCQRHKYSPCDKCNRLNILPVTE